MRIPSFFQKEICQQVQSSFLEQRSHIRKSVVQLFTHGMCM